MQLVSTGQSKEAIASLSNRCWRSQICNSGTLLVRAGLLLFVILQNYSLLRFKGLKEELQGDQIEGWYVERWQVECWQVECW